MDTFTSFTCANAIRWTSEKLYWAVAGACLYVLTVLVLKKWMEKKTKYELKLPLILWNTGLAVFSIIGTFITLPPLTRSVHHKGFTYTTCTSDYWWSEKDEKLCFWVFCFVLSKIIEYFDTLFIVLRKRDVMFLHVYHHTTISLLVWYAFADQATGMLHWCATVNFFIHSIMYSYYAICSAGIRLPRIIPACVTILQMIQFIVGATVNIVAFIDRDSCPHVTTAWLGAVLVLSYLLLFLQYFFNRYVFKTKKKEH